MSASQGTRRSSRVQGFGGDSDDDDKMITSCRGDVACRGDDGNESSSSWFVEEFRSNVSTAQLVEGYGEFEGSTSRSIWGG